MKKSKTKTIDDVASDMLDSIRVFAQATHVDILKGYDYGFYEEMHNGYKWQIEHIILSSIVDKVRTSIDEEYGE